jgi:hypothetical protein
MTYDGYVLHQCCIAEYIDDCQRIGGFNRYLGREMNPEEIRKYGKTRKQPNFVKLYRLANEYPIYRPSKREFEQYANENYAGENLNQIIQTKCSSQIDTLAEWDNVSSDIMCVRIAGQIADIISDRYGHVDDNDEIDDILIGYLDRHGIYADSIDGDFEDFINDLKRNVRMWRLHGHTIKEIEEK